MNRHFHDARYYLQRAGEHVKLGLKEELEPVEHRVRALRAEKDDEEPTTRLEAIKGELEACGRTAEREVETTVATATETLAEYRTGRDRAA